MKASLLTRTLSLATFVAMFFMSFSALAQLKVGDNPTFVNGSAVLDVESTNKGLLVPRMALAATTNPTPLTAHVAGMTIYNTATAADVVPGFYYNDGTQWVPTASQPNYTETNGAGAPTGTGSPGQSYTDTLETSPTYGNTYVYDTTTNTWRLQPSKTKTPFYLGNLTSDAGGNKTAQIVRYGPIQSRTATLPMYSQLLQNGGLRLFRSSALPAANSPTTNGYIDFAANSNDLTAMRLAMRSDASLGDYAFSIQDHGTPRMTVLQGGFVGIGTGLTKPGVRLRIVGNAMRVTNLAGDVNGDLYNGTADIGGSDITGVEVNAAGYVGAQRGAAGFIAGHPAGTANGAGFTAFYYNGTLIGAITQATVSSTNYLTTSDMRLKENIKNTHYGLSDLMKVRVADYNYKADKNVAQTGFIAQELYKVFPMAVTKGGDDAKKNPWSVDYGKMTPLIVQAVQDQQEIIEKQQAEINALKAANLALKAQANEVATLKADMASIKALLGVSKEVTQKVATK